MSSSVLYNLQLLVMKGWQLQIVDWNNLNAVLYDFMMQSIQKTCLISILYCFIGNRNNTRLKADNDLRRVTVAGGWLGSGMTREEKETGRRETVSQVSGPLRVIFTS